MTIFHWLCIITITVTGILCAVHALLNKRDPSSALIWSTLCLLLPLAGSLLYVIFGLNRISRHAQRLLDDSLNHDGPGTLSAPTLAADAALLPAACDRTIIVQEPGQPAKSFIPPAGDTSFSNPGMAGIGYRLTGLPLLEGNTVTPLSGGEEAYPAMMQAIEEARREVWLSSFIFDNDEIGGQFIDALDRAKQRGVHVRVLVDGLGTFLTRPRIDKVLQRRGLRAARFIPPQLFPPQFSINLRNHRKVLVVDGLTAFTGGMNISSRHLVKGIPGFQPSFFHRPPAAVQDMHFQIQGPVVRHLQYTFARDWQFTTHEKLSPCLPDPARAAAAGPSCCRTILDGPDDFYDRFYTVLVAAISAARQRVTVITPYFLPQAALTSAMQSAALRGVAVNIILPAMNNHAMVKWASYNTFRDLLERGVRIFFQPPPFNHTKLLLVDDTYTHLGSANLDPRSYRLNFELTMEVFDAALNRQLTRHALSLLEASHEYTLADLDARSLPTRIRDAFFWIFSPYL